MILDDKDLKRILVEKPNGKLFDDVKKYTQKLLMHIKGVGLDKYIERINMFEKADLVAIRKKYAVSNKSIFSRIHRPKDKIFSAKGGSVYYSMPETQKQDLAKMMGNIVYGYSVKQWLRVFWAPAIEYDPMGLIFIEIDANGNAYPTYKSVLDIFDYQMNGRNIEYVIFNVDNRINAEKKRGNYNVYRVVDDVSDRLVQVSGSNIKIIADNSFPNYFMKVPASIISNEFDPVRGYFISGDDDVVELADQYLQQGSIKNIYKNFFGFPRAWEYGSACPECKGTGRLDGRECNFCAGSGQKARTDVSETIRVPVPKTKDQPILAPEVAGYITPDIKGWEKMDGEMKLLEDQMFQTRWGTHQAEQADNNTATGKFIDIQPVNDALCTISECAEMMETFITELIGGLAFPKTFIGCSVTYGKRYILEGPDEILKRVQEGIKTGMPITGLYDLWADYLESRYSANAIELQRMLKLAKIEPMPFMTYEQMSKLQLPSDIMLRKIWFEMWVNAKTDQELEFQSLDKLQADFEDFCQEKDDAREKEEETDPAPTPAQQPPKPAPKPAPAAA